MTETPLCEPKNVLTCVLPLKLTEMDLITLINVSSKIGYEKELMVSNEVEH